MKKNYAFRFAIPLQFVFLFIGLSATTMFAQPFTDSNLPIVVITTDIDPNTSLPFPIVDDPRVLATMKIIKHPDGTRNYLTDINTAAYLNYNGRISIEIRGSTSQDLPKKPYGLTTLLADNVSNNNVSLLGMASENDWILNSFAYDRSYMRDYISYNLYNQIGNYGSKTNYCEVVVNGEYVGLYILQEKLKADSNRINVLKILTTDNTTETVTGGYITKADKTTGGDIVAWQMPPFYGPQVNFIHDLPKDTEVTATQNTYINNQFTTLQANATNSSIVNGYPTVIDVPSFVDFMLINELASNVDAYQYSTYFHKDRAGKLRAGPVWDLNLTYGNDLSGFNPSRSVTNQWQFSNVDNVGPTFWTNLYLNGTFKCYLAKRWNELIQTGKPLNQTNINALLDATVLLIAEGADRDAQKWFSSTANLAPKVLAIKNFVTARITWMTTNLGSFTACNAVVVPSLVISRIHYNPQAFGGFTSNDQEFIEITNTGTTTVNLSGIYLRELGVSYQFPYNSTVAAGQKLYLASNATNFQGRYGFAPFGQFARNLSNKSQKLLLADAYGNTIDYVEFLDNTPWPASADGTGPYLQLIDNSFDNSLAASWTTSTSALGLGEVNYISNTTFYPNPTTDQLNVTSDEILTKIEIFDYNGRLLKVFHPNAEAIQLYVSDFESGIYLIKFFNQEKVKVEKFLKK
ncbi:MAG: CotH kinase family protein [Bacteroidota bacterium]